MATSVSITTQPLSTAPPTSTGADTEAATYQFVLGWVLMIVLLVFVNKTKLGHVAIYYSLILLIMLILLVETNEIAPILSSLRTIGQLPQ